MSNPKRPPLAVVGVSALFPGSLDATGFWTDILAGTFSGSPWISLGTMQGWSKPQQILDQNGDRIVLNQFWNYETEMDNLFYNLFSATLVMECIEGDIDAPLSKAIDGVHLKIKKFQDFVQSIIQHVQEDFSSQDGDAAANALVAIWTIGEIFRFQTDTMLDNLKERIARVQPPTDV